MKLKRLQDNRQYEFLSLVFKPSRNMAKIVKRVGIKEKLYSKQGLGSVLQIEKLCVCWELFWQFFTLGANFGSPCTSPSMCLTPAIYASCSCYFKCLGSDNASNYTTLVIVTFLLPPIYFVGYISFRRYKRSSTKLYITYFFNPFLQFGLLAGNSYHFT